MLKLSALTLMLSVVNAACGVDGDGQSPSSARACAQRYEAARDRFAAVSADPSEVGPAGLTEVADEVQLAIAKCPAFAPLHVLIAEVEMSRGANATAWEHVANALDLDPDSALAHHVAGQILSLRGESAKAIEHLEMSLDLAPDNALMRLNLCSTLEQGRRYKEAIAECTRVVEESDDPSLEGPAFYIRGRSLQALGRADDAKLDFNEARELGYDLDRYYAPEHYELHAPQ